MARPAWHHDKRSSTDRGYGYQWQKLRLVILKRDGYQCRCDDCKRDGLLNPATHVDHIVSKADWLRKRGTLDGVDHPSNLRAINKDCHDKKSVMERGYRPAQRIGEDGFPIEDEPATVRRGVAGG